MEKLKSQPVPPYFISYEVTETHYIDVAGSFGTLIRSNGNRWRVLDILVSQLEVQKKQKSQERSPILAPPFDDR